MSQPADEFREWMIYLASRHHALLAATDLHECLADELCRPPPPPPVPAGYPMLCRSALIGATVRITDPARLRREFKALWTEAATLAAADAEGWADRFVAALRHSQAFVAGRARDWPSLGPDREERARAVSDASEKLFSRLWDKHGATVAGEKFRARFCPGGASGRAYLRGEFNTWLRDGGSQTLLAPDPAAPDKAEPMVSGTRVRVVTRLMELSRQVLAAAQAAHRPGAPPDPRADRLSDAHAEAVLALARGDKHLPQTLATVKALLHRFGGAMGAILSLDSPMPGSDGLTFADAQEAEDGLIEHVGARREALLRIYRDPALVSEIERRFDAVFPDRDSRIRGALVHGFPFLLAGIAGVHPTLPAIAAGGPPKTKAAWDRLARMFRTDVATLQREAREQRRRLAEGFAGDR